MAMQCNAEQGQILPSYKSRENAHVAAVFSRYALALRTGTDEDNSSRKQPRATRGRCEPEGRPAAIITSEPPEEHDTLPSVRG
jgi:hypothetical protein